MTNKQLIDYCNANWNKGHRCADCPYLDTYCDKFRDEYGDTPFLNDPEHTWSDGRYYTDEEIEL